MTFANLLDFAASLAVIALLAESYGILRRRIVGPTLAPMVLGALFGLIVVVQMHFPLTPFDGVIIDMRNIPIALAGAFLGWRGLLPCLAIAVAARMGIGGVGAAAGIAGMAISGLAGMIWARRTAVMDRRNFSMLLCLALAMSCHLMSAVILPREMAIWVFTSAAGPILTLNLIVIPLAGALLEREHRRIRAGDRRANPLYRDQTDRFPTGQSYLEDVKSAFAAHPFGTFAGMLVVQVRPPLLERLFGQSRNPAVRPRLLPSMFEPVLTHGALAGQSLDGRVFVPVTEAELMAPNTVLGGLRDTLSEAQDGRAAPRVQLDLFATPDPETFLRIVEHVALSMHPDWAADRHRLGLSPLNPGQVPALRRARIFDPEQHNVLFAKADYLMDRSSP